MEKVFHTLKPIVFENSEMLILGSIPSPKSRESGFYYGHPQNRFWKVMAAVYDESTPMTVDEKIHFLRQHKIALWDVLESCDIIGASDASIRNPKANNIAGLLQGTRIARVFTTGATAHKLYNKLALESTGVVAILLPSPSPANAAWNVEKLTKRYKELMGE